MLARVEVAISIVDHLYSVPDALGYQMRGKSQFYQQADMGMPQIVDANPGYSGLLGTAFNISFNQAVRKGENPV